MKKLLAVIVVIVAVLWYLGWQTENQPEPVEPTATPVATPAARGGGGPQDANREAGFAQEAQSMGLQLRDYRPQPNGATITIAWTGDVATVGGDYLQACINAGLMRDFELPGDQAIAMENGQRVWIARYRVKF